MTVRKRVLFVDDEPRVLDGLRRILHGQRAEWEMEFVESGPLALMRMEVAPFDVIITDMRMPGMDGAALLDEVMDRFPQTVRIVLSGQADREHIYRLVGLAHQYLSKPCEAETIRSTVERATGLRQFLQNEGLVKFASHMPNLPSLPRLYHEVMTELRRSEPSVRTVAEIIERDPGMSAKVLQMINSAFFGLPRKVTSPRIAVNLLGLETVKSVLLLVGAFGGAAANTTANDMVERTWEHSMAVAQTAREFARKDGADRHALDEVTTAGLLHDCGKLILLANVPVHYEELLAEAAEKRMAVYEAERDVLGVNHGEVGGYLLGLWGLPDPIIEAVTFHHTPRRCTAEIPTPLAYVHMADSICQRAENAAEAGAESPLDLDYLARVGIRVPQRDELRRPNAQETELHPW
jgi:HD-like signal output (HDOD) protein